LLNCHPIALIGLLIWLSAEAAMGELESSLTGIDWLTRLNVGTNPMEHRNWQKTGSAGSSVRDSSEAARAVAGLTGNMDGLMSEDDEVCSNMTI